VTRAVAVHRLAEHELNEVAQYYDLESPGLGVAFLKEVDRCIKIMPEEIRVLAVMNLKRRPMYWVGRE